MKKTISLLLLFFGFSLSGISQVFISACESYNWSVNNMTYTTSGIYTTSFINTSGTPQYDTLHLTITNNTSASDTVNTCHQYTWALDGLTYTASGIYTHTSLTTNTCIHTDSLLLTIVPLAGISQTVTACDSYTWAVNGITYSASGLYTFITIDPVACDHIDTLILTINNTNINTSYVTACDSYTWPVNGITYTTSCVKNFTLYNGTVCPDLYVLCLTIVPTTYSDTAITACDQYSWVENGMTYTVSGVYIHTSLNANGCIHTATLNLSIHSSTTSSFTASSCNTFTWNLNGVTYTASGIYTFTSLNTNACPHTSTLNLSITNGTNTSIQIIACDSYTWFGITYTASGIYTHTSITTSGCLQTTTLHLTINDSSVITTYITSCGPYTWSVNGVTYTASGTYSVFTIAANGCPTLYVLCLSVYQPTSSSETITACNSYTWVANSLTYTTSGMYTYTSLNTNGCVDTATLNLTIQYGTSSISSATTCNAYTWNVNGLTYTTSGVYTFTSTGTQTCPNTNTLNLTVFQSINSTISLIACNEYLWPVNGITYTASGIYTFTSLTSNGCINSWLLTLSIRHSTSSTSSVTACDAYTWPVNGIIYNTSGNYSATYLNSQGCPHTINLMLTINHSSNTTVNVVGCEMYTWPENGVTYIASGTYTQTSINSSGCLHTATLILTLGTTTTTHIFDIACCSYTWALNGVTYTTSGIYPIITNGPEGCPHFIILCVTIYPCVSNSSTVVACGSYTWNGMTYTHSGIYTHTELNAYGCPTTDTLQLTIGTGVATTSSCDTVCDFFVWNVNGITYTNSGVYTHVVYDTNACPHVYILCITIHHHTTSSLTATALNAYTWSANGITYTLSGVYTATLINAQNCDSILTLNLSITSQQSPVLLGLKTMLSGPYKITTGLMSDSLRVLNFIPLAEPYSGSPFFKPQLLGGGGESTTAAVLSVAGNDAIVDWIHIEIRSGANSNTILATKNALLQRDGDIVSSLDGVSTISFPTLAPGNYFISLKHRNHLGVMTASSISLNTGMNYADFTTIPLYTIASITSNPPSNVIGSFQLLWSGDLNTNKNVKYNGLLNDKDPILNTVGVGTPNNTVFGYRREDLNMDGKVRYNNPDNDRAFLLIVVGISTPNRILSQHTPN